MRDGFTRKVETPEKSQGFADYMTKWRASVVILSGDAAGTEWLVERPTQSIGRSTECDWTVADDSMSKEHAALEFSDGGFRLRDLGSMNGMIVNGSESRAADLKSGDRFQLGEHEFQFVLEKNGKARTWVLPDA